MVEVGVKPIYIHLIEAVQIRPGEYGWFTFFRQSSQIQPG
jgi:hypothetical protein